jgi:hypothetical protein
MYTNALVEGQLLSRLCVICMPVGRNRETRDQTERPLDLALMSHLSDIAYDA